MEGLGLWAATVAVMAYFLVELSALLLKLSAMLNGVIGVVAYDTPPPTTGCVIVSYWVA